MRAIRFERTGGPEVLQLVDVPTPTPGAGEVLVRHEAIGVNFIDTYFRSGLYPAELPAGPGVEGAGIVEAVGDGVKRFKVGDHVAYYASSPGSYAEYRVMPEGRTVAIPEGVDAHVAAAALLKGMTAEFLLRRTYPVKSGDTVLVHAAAGGVGQIMVQWAKDLGATVIGTAGSAEKRDRATALGADHMIDYGSEDVAARVRELTAGKGVPVVYDGVGKSTFDGSLKSLHPRGMFVSYGNASGAPAPVEPQWLARNGSLFFTRPTLIHYIATTEELDACAAAVFDVIARGVVDIEIGQTFALADARQAHEALEARATIGSTLLLP
jgi:NADPH2:quinone reductase